MKKRLGRKLTGWLGMLLTFVMAAALLPAQTVRAADGSYWIEPQMLPSGDYQIKRLEASLPYEYPPIAGMKFSTWEEKGVTIDKNAPYTGTVTWSAVKESGGTSGYFSRDGTESWLRG
ncbi:MAG: hypothetical protein E7425_09905 [Ruminococcaceae bacterium]|nr:hypothetical protein [Oscillospiraceae bacterium]